MVQAAPPASSGGGGITTILFLLLLMGVVYFMMIRPQQKRRREAQAMQSALGPGDRIVTIGGLHADVISIDGEVATLEIAPGVRVEFARQAIARALPRPDAADESDGTLLDEPAAGELAEPVEDTAADARKKD